MKITREDEDVLRQKVADICDILYEGAEKEADATGRTAHSVICTTVRKYIKEITDPDTRAAESDNREKEWEIDLKFWEVTDGLERGQLLAETDPEVVQGFSGVEELIIDYTKQVHEDQGVDITRLDPFTSTNMSKRLGGIRPAISRGGGFATTKIPYVVNDFAYLIFVNVKRKE